MRVAVCDDDQFYIDSLKEGIRRFSEKHRVSVEISAFTQAEDLLSRLSKMLFDLYFLDIDFGDKMNGYALAKTIRKVDQEVPIVFVTNYDTYLREGYELNILRYFNKPVPQDKLDDVLSLVLTRLSGKEKGGSLLVPDGKKKIPFDDILSIEYSNHRILIHMTGRDEYHRLYEAFSEFSETLPKDVFLRCHQSFLVNMTYVDNYTANEILLTDGSRIPVSRSYKAEAHQILRRYFTGETL